VDYLHESAAAIYRRRRHRRAMITLTCVCVLLLATVLYAASYIQGWVGGSAPKAVANASCSAITAAKVVRPKDVTINVYNSTDRIGLAAAVARSLEKQGFNVDAIDNDPLGRSVKGPAEIRHGPIGTAGAILAAARLPGATVLADDRADASVDLVIGDKFKNITRKDSRVRAAALTKQLTAKSKCQG
jgi:hypothetical protein